MVYAQCVGNSHTGMNCLAGKQAGSRDFPCVSVDGTCCFASLTHANYIRCRVSSVDGAWGPAQVVSASYDGCIRTWNMAGGCTCTPCQSPMWQVERRQVSSPPNQPCRQDCQ